METLTKKEAMYKRIEKHGINLNKIFHTGYEPIVLYKKLHSLEIKANQIMCDKCNGEDIKRGYTLEGLESLAQRILGYKKYNELVHLNHDPRGYTFKIDDKIVREQSLEIHRDWGGYGIIAPDLTGE